jgi:ATP-dependent Clp protease ATP-binding subunit ClpA
MPASPSSKGAAGHQGGSLPEQRLRADVRGLVQLAIVEASNRGAGAVEAEHLLLALLFDRRNHAATALAAAGLDYEALAHALTAERENSLRTAGVEPIAPDRLAAAGRRERPRWGTSAKQALMAGHRMASTQRGHSMRHADVAAGILSSGLGTVPRALAYAGFDRARLLQAVVSATQEA